MNDIAKKVRATHADTCCYQEPPNYCNCGASVRNLAAETIELQGLEIAGLKAQIKTLQREGALWIDGKGSTLRELCWLYLDDEGSAKRIEEGMTELQEKGR
jgi:hypothetical protein